MGIRIACLSGWGQPHDSLDCIIPDQAVACHIDYARHGSINAAILHIAELARTADMLIGWSLGGQMALRAIASGMVKPAKLVLIATPYQFVKNKSLPIGMPADTFAQFQDNYTKNPQYTLKKAWELIAKDDKNAETVKTHLQNNDKQSILSKNWAIWLQILENYNCKALNTTECPPTLLIHGTHDLVVFHEQSEQMLAILPTARLETFTQCGHAPHWHDAARVKDLITAHAHL